MENVAAVTFNEKYVSKGEKSRALKINWQTLSYMKWPICGLEI